MADEGDAYMIELLKSDAARISGRFKKQWPSSDVQSRPAAKPNTGFLRRLIATHTSHNDNLLERELVESERKLFRLGGDPGQNDEVPKSAQLKSPGVDSVIRDRNVPPLGTSGQKQSGEVTVDLAISACKSEEGEKAEIGSSCHQLDGHSEVSDYPREVADRDFDSPVSSSHRRNLNHRHRHHRHHDRHLRSGFSSSSRRRHHSHRDRSPHGTADRLVRKRSDDSYRERDSKSGRSR
jgi:hypothetical protein